MPAGSCPRHIRSLGGIRPPGRAYWPSSSIAGSTHEAAGTILALVLPSAATHTYVLANRLNVAERTEGKGTVMHRRAFVGACLTLVLLVAVGMPAVASPATSAARKPKATTIPVGLGPVRVATNPQTNTIYVTNTGDGTVSVINGKKNRVVATIPVGVSPVGVATNPQTNTAYAVDPATRTLSVIDGATNTVTATILGIFNPAGVATNPQTNTIYVTDAGLAKVAVIDGATNTVTATIPVGSSPAAVATNPQTNTIYVAHTISSSGTLSVISGQTNSVTATVPVGQFPGGVASNPQTNTVYVANIGSSSVSVVPA
jgi:YVTN family beta-propeller protein